MDKRNFTNNNINKKSRKDGNTLYLIINNNPGLSNYNPDLNLNNTSLSLNLFPNSFYYLPWNNICLDSFTTIKNSFVMSLAKTILQNIDIKSVNFKSNQILSSDFYHICLNNLTNIINDKELLLLFLKQLTLILKNTTILDNPNEFFPVNNSSYYNIQLYLKMLNSFWNKMNWDLLFPSMPEAATKLMINKKLLINLILRKKTKFRIDTIANAFLKSSGLGRANDLLLISFLDFGIFTWLGHFGIINYLNGSDMDPVFVELTKHGRRMLEYLMLV